MTVVLHADYTLFDGVLQPHLAVSVGDDGRVLAVGPARELSAPSDTGESSVVRLAGKALLPGFVNAHSHAFQRVLRGRTEYREPGHEDDDFWAWRAAMYDAATRLDPEQIEAVTTFAYAEMLRAGYTHVAEFHYVHHQPDGTPYADPLELSRRVVASARTAGIGMTLLPVAYQRGGPGTPASAKQRRFLHRDADAFANTLSGSRELADLGRCPVQVGMAAHSVRALDRSFLEEMAALGGVVHAHVNEQPKEIAQCLAEHGLRPIELLADVGLLSPQFVGVHATHIDEAEVRLLGESGAQVCVCPTTERNLGDGLPPLRDLVDAGVSLSIGSDSHANVDPFAEIAALENGERLRSGKRNVLAGVGPGGAVGGPLIAAGTRGGARACGLDAGRIHPGSRADLVSIDLESPRLVGSSVGAEGGHSLLAAMALSGSAELVQDVWVGGARVVNNGHHPGWREARAGFETVMRSLVS
ncbi:MAG: formimidoylglutamate deiminase [Deltaproteobacteria bacterium]|nr:formimidoylglutamate deiminase [Deltaproteobacteria bacterium]